MFLQFKDLATPIEVELVNFEQGKLIIGYYSIAENNRYILQTSVEGTEYIVGLAPYGGVTIWSTDKLKRIIIKRLYAEPLINQQYTTIKSNLPSRDLYENYMKQYIYRYQVFFEHWDKNEKMWIKYSVGKNEVVPVLKYIEESLYDGTLDKLHDEGLMKYHIAGKPKMLALKWNILKSDYSAYFWFTNEDISDIFNKFYGLHPDTNTDFIIHIDPIQKKYQLSLYRFGLKAPVIIPESAYQLIVFKSGFENYRSENYNQPTGAWIW